MTTTPPDPRSAPRARRSLTARCPEDLLAAVPVVLGFHPQRSIVMLTFAPPGTAFHARVDLPGPDDLAAASRPLLDAARRHGIRRAAFVLYTDDPLLGAQAAAVLAADAARARCEVVTMLRADGHRWFDLATADGRSRDWGDAGQAAGGTGYDLRNHRFVAESVYHGAVTHPTREALAASLDMDPAAAAAVGACLAGARTTRPTAGPGPGEERWAVEVTGEGVREGRRLSDEEVARLVLALQDLPVRDALWCEIGQEEAAAQVAFWADLLPRVPEELAAPPAALLAFASWLAGQGALAWCAVDRSRRADPDYRLADYVAAALERAVPPSAWVDGSRAPGRHPLVS